MSNSTTMSKDKSKAAKSARPAYHVRDLALAPQGKNRILWADHDMPVLQEIRTRFEKEKPLKGQR